MLLFLRCDHGRQLCEHQHNGRVRTHVMRRISCHNYSGHCPRGQLCHERFIIYTVVTSLGHQKSSLYVYYRVMPPSSMFSHFVSLFEQVLLDAPSPLSPYAV